MDVMVICVILAVGALIGPFAGPYGVRAVRFLARTMSLLSADRKEGRRTRWSLPLREAPYRGSKDARILALEAQLEEKSVKLEQAETLIEQLWYRVHEAERANTAQRRAAPEPPWVHGLVAAGCVGASIVATIGGLGLLQPRTAETGWRPRIEALPTMAPIPMRTSGGELPIAMPRLYVIVLISPPYDEILGRCYDGPLVLEPLFTIVELSDDGERFHILWTLASFDPDPPIPPLRL